MEPETKDGAANHRALSPHWLQSHLKLRLEYVS
jgi:hypothetical protein